MADAEARRAAIKKASSQVRAGGVFVSRSSASGAVRPSNTGRVTSRGSLTHRLDGVGEKVRLGGALHTQSPSKRRRLSVDVGTRR